MIALFMSIHLLAAVVWVGGMFFAYLILRPVAVAELEAPQRLRLWSQVFRKFFVWVWAAVLLLPLSGTAMAWHLFGGFAHAPLYVHVMLMLGTIMILIFAHVYFAPARRLHQAVQEGAWQEGGRQLNLIRKLVGVNLMIGLLVLTAASGGRFLV